MLSETGAPTPVAWTRMRAPRSLMAQIGRHDPAAGGRGLAAAGEVRHRDRPRVGLREAAIPSSPQPRHRHQPRPPPGAQTPTDGKPAARAREAGQAEQPSAVEQVLKSPAFKSFARSTATVLGREITRGIFGTASRSRRR